MLAVILCGGKGSRLKTLSSVFPKPLVPVRGKPILEWLILNLSSQGIRDFIFCVGHQAGLIKAYFGNGKKFGVRINYSLEKSPLGTAGPLTLLSKPPKSFFVCNADIFTDIDMRSLWESHHKNNTLLTVATKMVSHASEFGVLEVDEYDLLVKMIEKPKQKLLVSMGMYVVDRRVIKLIPAGQKFGFDALQKILIKNGKSPKVFRHTGEWRDLGRPQDILDLL